MMQRLLVPTLLLAVLLLAGCDPTLPPESTPTATPQATPTATASPTETPAHGLVDIREVGVGECFAVDAEAPEGMVRSADCQDGPYQTSLDERASRVTRYKLVGQFQIPDGAFPGHTKLQLMGDQRCGWAEGEKAIYPNESGWSVGHRFLLCLVPAPGSEAE